MAIDPNCFRSCYIACFFIAAGESGPLAGGICAVACYMACGGDPAQGAGADTLAAGGDDGSLIPDTGQDPTLAAPSLPEFSGELNPIDPSENTGNIGDAPGSGDPNDTYANDWGSGSGGGGGGSLPGDDGGEPGEDKDE